MFRKVTFIETLSSPLLTGVEDLQYMVYNATKSELLDRFLKGALKLTEEF